MEQPSPPIATTRAESSARVRNDPAPNAGSAPSSGWGRVPELDALRAFGALAVMIYHLKPAWLPRAWIAVDLFFILSGYLITAIILKHGRNRGFLFGFYARRGLRILPVYLLTLLALAALSPLLPRPCDFAGLPYQLTYMHTLHRYGQFHVPEFSPYLLHTWTIAIEEQFYLFWPLLLLMGGRMRVLALGAALVAVSSMARSMDLHWWAPLGRLDSLALGGMLAAILTDRRRVEAAIGRYRWGFGLVASAGLTALLVAVFAGGFPPHGQPGWPAVTVLAASLMWFGAVGLVITHTGHPALAVLRRPRLCFLGQMSYSLYLYHLVVFWVAEDYFHKLGLTGRPLWRDALLVTAVVALAMLSWRYIERPLLSFKDRFSYGRPRLKPEAAAPGGPHGPHTMASRVNQPASAESL